MSDFDDILWLWQNLAVEYARHGQVTRILRVVWSGSARTTAAATPSIPIYLRGSLFLRASLREEGLLLVGVGEPRSGGLPLVLAVRAILKYGFYPIPHNILVFVFEV